MTTDNNKEIEEIIMRLRGQSNYSTRTEYETFHTISESDLVKALLQAHQAGIDEAVEMMSKIKIEKQSYIDGLAPKDMNYENSRFIEAKGVVLALDDTIKALQDNK